MVAPTMRSCKQCGSQFALNKGDEQFCSLNCYWTADRSSISKTCEWCSKQFVTQSAKAMYCSDTCRQTMVRMRNGSKIPKRLSGPVLDYLFRQQGLRITYDRAA